MLALARNETYSQHQYQLLEAVLALASNDSDHLLHFAYMAFYQSCRSYPAEESLRILATDPFDTGTASNSRSPAVDGVATGAPHT